MLNRLVINHYRIFMLCLCLCLTPHAYSPLPTGQITTADAEAQCTPRRSFEHSVWIVLFKSCINRECVVLVDIRELFEAEDTLVGGRRKRSRGCRRR